MVEIISKNYNFMLENKLTWFIVEYIFIKWIKVGEIEDVTNKFRKHYNNFRIWDKLPILK